MASSMTRSVFTKRTDDIAVDEIESPRTQPNLETEDALENISFSYEMVDDPKFHDLFRDKTTEKQFKPH